MPDSGAPLAPRPDASLPPAFVDQGECAEDDHDCARAAGHASTTLGSATCTIGGDFLVVAREVCEVCSKSTAIVDFGLTVMDCEGCAYIYSEGAFTPGVPLTPGACTRHADTATLTFTLSDPLCIDVDARLGSGDASASGTFTRSGELVRVCRCDRTTDACTSCVGGACEAAP